MSKRARSASFVADIIHRQLLEGTASELAKTGSRQRRSGNSTRAARQVRGNNRDGPKPLTPADLGHLKGDIPAVSDHLRVGWPSCSAW